MRYQISVESRYLRAQLVDKETVGDMLEFFDAVASASTLQERPSILLDVRSSRAIFHIGVRRLFERFAGHGTACRIALLADTSELQMSHDYLALLARQLRLDVASFRDEGSAVRWLLDDGDERRSRERREQHVAHDPERRALTGRRGDDLGRPGAF